MVDTRSSSSLSRRSLLKSSAMLSALLIAPWAASAPVSAAGAAESYVASLGKSILVVARAGGSRAQMSSKFRVLMARNAAISAIGIFSLGKYKSKLPRAKRSEYFKLIEKFVAGLFVKYAKEFAGNRIEVTGSKARSAKDIIVSSKVHFANGKAPLDVKWRLLKSGGGYKIFDVRVLGVWLAIQQRSEFVSVIKRNNGDVNALLKFLRK